uniref:DNA topoisomerase n=1 Tax=Parastrongyloides trichosuri TaxID=131310 RepID=A0A0N4ZWC0_PARTI
MPIKVLMVAEKPSLARTISNILSNGSAKQGSKNDGEPSKFFFNGTFNDKNADFIMTSTFGHMKEICFAGEYTNWMKPEKELFKCPLEKLNIDKKFAIDKFLRNLFKNCDYLVLWLDNDREGENICFEVMDACQQIYKGRNFNDCVYRARFSALMDEHIKDAMDNLIRPNRNESDSVDALHEVDLRIGCSFTRFQTKLVKQFRNRGKYISCLSYGPCQTPTLNFCVQRHKQIQNDFVKPYWRLKLTLKDSKENIEFSPTWNGDNCFDEEEFKKKILNLRKNKFVKVLDVSRKEVIKNPPKALNTVELLKGCSKNLSISPNEVMSIAEKLYINGYISYPRTETTLYPVDFKFNEVLEKLKRDNEWREVVNNVLNNGICLSSRGKDKGDHPPITPVKPSYSNLNGKEKDVHNFIIRNFIASVMNPCKYDTYSIKVSLNEEIFTYHTRQVTDKGYTSFLADEEVSEPFIPLNIEIDSLLPVVSLRSEKCKTKLLTHLTESELISLMEKHQIGTDASIAGHIENLMKRNFATIERGRKVVPTELGIKLIDIYEKIDQCLISSSTRAETEMLLSEIASGKRDKNNVVSHILNKYSDIFDKLIYEFPKYSHEIFEAIPLETKNDKRKDMPRKRKSTSTTSTVNKKRKPVKK